MPRRPRTASLLAALAALTVFAGCGSVAPEDKALRDLTHGAAEGVVTMGTSDLAIGPARLTFVLARANGRLVESSKIALWLARHEDSPPLTEAIARREPVTVAGLAASPFGTRFLYVAHVRLNAGSYRVLVRSRAPKPVQAEVDINVRPISRSLPVGAAAPRSRTPTIASSGKNLAAITTHVPPDRNLLQF